MKNGQLSIDDLMSMDWAHDEPLVRSLWWDWFCPEDQLFRRGKRLLACLRGIADSPLFDKRRCRTFFKNIGLPEKGGRDHFYIEPMEETPGLPWFCVAPPNPRETQARLFAGITGNAHSVSRLVEWNDLLDFFAAENTMPTPCPPQQRKETP